MNLSGILDWLDDSAELRTWRQALRHAPPARHASVIRAARPILTAYLARHWSGSIVYLTARNKRAHNVVEQLPLWLVDSRPILRYADPAPMFYDRLPWDASVIRERLEVLDALMTSDTSTTPPFIVTSLRALLQRTLPPSLYRAHSLTLKLKERHKPEKLAERLVSMGYEPSTLVVEQGTFSKRGGLLDIFPMNAVQPVRVDFFDDEIDSLKPFEVSSQRTIGKQERLYIPPAREVPPSLTPPLASTLAPFFAHLSAAQGELNPFSADIEALSAGQSFGALEFYLPYLIPQPASLLDYLPADALIVVEDENELSDEAQTLIDSAEANRQANLSAHQLPDKYPQPYVTWTDLLADIQSRSSLFLSNNPSEESHAPMPSVFRVGQRWGGQTKGLANDIAKAQKQGESVVIISEQIERLAHQWQEQSGAEFVPKFHDLYQAPAPASLSFLTGQLSEGWTARTEAGTLHLISDAEAFSWARHEPRRRQTRHSAPPPESDYADWTTGEYVVHIDFGIGRYVGLQRQTADDGAVREYLLLEYSGTDKLYVPIHHADRVARFIGADDEAPKLNNLGRSAEWLRAKDRARQAAELEAQELLEIYAKRSASQGYTYSPDGEFQRELEASFPFIETDDQLRVVREIKQDMEQSKPMDRLVCGDVGFGKTEVAVRAAFKAVMDGKQVAVLVPTTVLAEQHYHTFRRRMSPFGARIEVISRFRTKLEQERVLKQLLNGEIDIMVGTHRILSDDVTFKDLGLVIIDEEQRFGVKHKDHFKKLRAFVDVLTLTATPIPRTLYLSLSNVRDISMIQTPPQDRLPIMTTVSAFNAKLARQAILRELDRGGQVFIIHNRVKSIDSVRERFLEIVPEARIVVAHGQMNGKQLEGIIEAFSEGEYDILLSTSIIENGIDMPNVNTILVDRADWFGLSQLYQLRGRVGRSTVQAYAYFFHPANGLTEEARVRLETLAEHMNLGAGFQIAMRDLELRGAGDILSARQSGHVTNVGLGLYTQLLQQAVNRLKAQHTGTPAPASISTPLDSERLIIDLPIAAYIPEGWIPEVALRLQLYRRIGNLQSLLEVDALGEELRDRFGALPAPVEGLLYQIRVKILGQAVRASAIQKPRERILIKLAWLPHVKRERLERGLGAGVTVTRVAVELTVEPQTWRARLLEVLSDLPIFAPSGVLGMAQLGV